MMLLTPITPATRVTTPTNHITSSIASNKPASLRISWSALKLPNACWSSGWTCWRRPSSASTSASTRLDATPSAAKIAKFPTLSPVPNARAKVVSGTSSVVLWRSASSPVCGERNTPTTMKYDPRISTAAPIGSSSGVNSCSRTCAPMTATLRRSIKSRGLRKRPRSMMTGWISSISAVSPATRKLPVLPPRWTLAVPRRPPPSSVRGATARIPGTPARTASASAMVSRTNRPGASPSCGIDVRCGHTYMLFDANPAMPRRTPSRRPWPKPSITISMKMPQNTPQAVNAARRRLRRSVPQISCQRSTSIIVTPPAAPRRG